MWSSNPVCGQVFRCWWTIPKRSVPTVSSILSPPMTSTEVPASSSISAPPPAWTVFGFAGLVDGLVGRLRRELPEADSKDVAVIGTGESAQLIMAESTSIDHHEPELTLEGLRLVYERNLAKRRAR